MDEKKYIEASVSDAIVEKPIRFSIGKSKFSIYPPTLGKLQILSKYYLMLDIDEQALSGEPHLEAMRVCEAKTDTVCQLMAAATLDTKEDLLDDEKICELAGFFKFNAYPPDFGTVLLALLTQVHYENFMSSIRLTRILRQNAPRA